MKKVRGIKKESYDVLIIDRVGSEWLEYCIPKECSRYALEVRKTIPFVKSPSFFYNLFKYVIRHGVNSTSLLSAIVFALKPRVVITFIDNYKFMGKLQTIFPDTLVISVQNGSRDEDGDPCFEPCDNYLDFPNYFGFGANELSIITNKNCSLKSYHSSGSLKAGVFLSKFYSQIQQEESECNICLISQYVHNRINWSNLQYRKYMLSLERACKLLSDFSQKNNININIAMRFKLTDEQYQDELTFFQKYFSYGNTVFHANNTEKMSSYQVGMNSNLVMAFHSTMIFELFGMGKKVLLYGTVDQELINFLGCGNSFNYMPSECLLDDWGYDNFEKKVKLLMKIDDSSFLDKTKTERVHYMEFGEQYTHQIVHNVIKNRCK